MDENAIVRYISETFEGVDVIEASGDWFFIYDPQRNLKGAQQMPFATLITNDKHDDFSQLSRPGVHRLNIGVSKETARSLFGEGETEIDFTALDQFLPHPVYGKMHWICVLNPNEATFETVKGYLAEAYQRAVKRLDKPRDAGE